MFALIGSTLKHLYVYVVVCFFLLFFFVFFMFFLFFLLITKMNLMQPNNKQLLNKASPILNN